MSSSSSSSLSSSKQQIHEPPTHLLNPYHYINSNPGKDVRGALIDCFQSWFCIQDENAIHIIKEIIADLHNASLLIDDIEDNSKLRRGQPVAHLIYGVAPVINCANYVYFLALQKCHSLRNDKAIQVHSFIAFFNVWRYFVYFLKSFINILSLLSTSYSDTFYMVFIRFSFKNY